RNRQHTRITTDCSQIVRCAPLASLAHVEQERTVGRLPPPILHRSLSYAYSFGAVFHGELANRRQDRRARPARWTRVPLPRLRLARARRPYPRLEGRVADRRRVKESRDDEPASSNAVDSPLGSPGSRQAPRHLSGSQFCLVSAYPPVAPPCDISA